MSQARLIFETNQPAGWAPDPFPALASRGAREVAFDTETTGLRWWAGDRPVGISVAWEGGSAYLPFGHSDGNLPEERVREWARAELRGLHLFGLNAKFDAHMLRAWGVDLEELGCRLGDVGHYTALLDDHHRGFSLEAVAQRFLGEGKVQGVDVTDLAKRPAWYVDSYARKDAELVGRILEKQRPLLERDDLLRVAALEDEVTWAIMEMERNAARLDLEKLKAWERESNTALQVLHVKIAGAVGFQVNPDSPESMIRLFRARGLHNEKTTATGKLSFTDDVMAGFAAKDPVVALVRQAAHLADLRAKYLGAYLGALDGDRLRFSLHQLRGDEFGTISGRLSSSQATRGVGANIQQVMAVEKQKRVHGDRWPIRELFIPGDGMLLLASDAKQIEYRLFAHYANSPALLDEYRKDAEADFHDMVGQMVKRFRPDFDRKRVKNVNFARLYGAGTKKIGAMLGVSEGEAQAFLTAYDRAFPEAKALLTRAMEVAEKRGYVRTLLGRRTRFPDGQRLHKALNGIIQGSAADLMKMKMIELHKLRKDLGLVPRMSVHDEYVADVPDQEAAGQVDQLLNRQSLELRVPILWDTGVGPNWAAM